MYITNRKNQENFNTTQAGTTSASGSITTQAGGSGTTQAGGSGTTQAIGSSNVELDAYNSLIGQDVNDYGEWEQIMIIIFKEDFVNINRN